MATHLAMLVIGHHDIVTRTPRSGTAWPPMGDLDPAIAARARSWIEQTPDVVATLATYFGRYPFDQIGGVLPGATGFTDSLETQTRAPICQRQERLQPDQRGAHERANRWFRDSVSVRHWHDVWLNEGFVTRAAWLYREHLGGPRAQTTAARLYGRYPAGHEFWTAPSRHPGASDEIHAETDTSAL